jgi:hypothetical protein
VSLDFVHCGGFVSESIDVRQLKLSHPRFEGVSEINAGALLGTELIPGLVQLETEFHVGDGVGCHHELIGVQAREQVLRYILVPGGALLRACKALLLPFRNEGTVDNVDDFDEEGSGARGGVEDLNERFVGRDCLRLAWYVREQR